MGATYTRQSTYADGDTITADHTNDEFDQLLAAFAASTGHTHDGTTAEGGPITSLLGTSITIGNATAGTDITVTFDGESNDGVLKWMEDEDYFEFSDDLLIASTEKIQFRDTGIYLNSSVDGQLDIVADTEVQIAATTIDINGAADISGNLGVGGNLTVTGTTTFNGGTITMGDAATDNVVFGADVNSSIIPNTDDTYDLGSASQEWRDLYLDGTAHIDTLDVDVNATVAGTLGVTGIATFTDDIIIGDGKTIGSASDVDAITIASNGQVTLTQTLIGTELDISGDIDVAGTANLDIVDIDGAVNMATTALVTGVLTTTATQVATGGITSGSNIVSDTDSTDDLGTTSVRWANLFVDGITATDQITATGFTGTLDGILGSGTAAAATVTTLDTSGVVNLNLVTDSTSSTSGALIVDGGVGVAKKLFVGTDLDVEGTANLDVVDIDGAVDMSSTLTVAGNSVLASVDVTGVATAATFEPDGDTAAGDNAAIGYTAAEGLILTGQGSTSDITLKNDADAVVFTVPTGTDDILFPDNAKAMFGAGSDLQIYHDGSNSYIDDSGTGSLIIQASNSFSIKSKQYSNVMVSGNDDGDVQLFHNGTSKLSTASGGVSVAGNVIATGTVEPAGDTAAGDNAAIGYTAAEGLILTGQGSTSDITLKNDADAVVFTVPTGTDDILFPDNAKAMFGAGSDLQIYHNATHSYIDNNTGNIYIRSNVDDDDGGNIVLEAKAGENGIIIADDGDVSLHFNGNLKLATTNTGVAITGDVVASGTVEPAGDTAAGDNAAVGYTAAEGLILTGQGSTNDVTIKNDADADVIEIPTGTTSVTMTGSLKPLTYQETYVSKSAASTVTCDLSTANHFAVTMDQNTTFAFTNPPTSGTSFAFTLIVTQHSTAVTLTWPGSVDWAGGSAPDAAGNNEVQAYGFITRDGGTTYYGFLGGTAIG